jgi:tetratricopeptide (TPR) repeat protein
MRARGHRQPIGDQGNRRGVAADAPRAGILGWLREHIFASVVGAALVATAAGWFAGFFDSILHETVPSATDAACALREAVEYHWPFAKNSATSNRFTILIATLDRDDADHTYTRAVARAFLKRDDIDRIETCRILRLAKVGRDAEENAVATARNWLAQRHADLLIGGEMLKKDEAVSLWFIDKDPNHDWRASTFRLDANLLKQDFAEAASTQLLAVALSSIKPATDENGKYLVTVLRPITTRLQNLLSFTGGFTAIQRADLQYALAVALYVIGDQAGDNDALKKAVAAYDETLKELTRERVPLDWATTQNNLGNALSRLGERESGTARLEAAVAAYNAALKERTRERVPLDWAMTQNNLGLALATLGERESGTARLEAAVAAYNAALNGCSKCARIATKHERRSLGDRP